MQTQAKNQTRLRRHVFPAWWFHVREARSHGLIRLHDVPHFPVAARWFAASPD